MPAALRPALVSALLCHWDNELTRLLWLWLVLISSDVTWRCKWVYFLISVMWSHGQAHQVLCLPGPCTSQLHQAVYGGCLYSYLFLPEGDFLFKTYFYLSLYMPLYLHHAIHVGLLLEASRCHWIPWNWRYRWLRPAQHSCWELN